MNPRDPKHVLIGMAVGNGTTRWETSMSLIRLCTESNPLGLKFSVVPGGGCDVAHARNLLLHYCLTKTDAGRLVFIDSDVVFTPRDVFRLCAWLEAGVGIISGIYPRKSLELGWSLSGGAQTSEVFPELWESPDLCTGFLGLDVRTVLQPMIEQYPETAYEIEDRVYRGETAHELFAMGVVNRRRLSEDYYFCHRAKAMGYKLFIDSTIQLGHVGTVDFLDLHQGKDGVLPRQT
jgi:hypothetical protein